MPHKIFSYTTKMLHTQTCVLCNKFWPFRCVWTVQILSKLFARIIYLFSEQIWTVHSNNGRVAIGCAKSFAQLLSERKCTIKEKEAKCCQKTLPTPFGVHQIYTPHYVGLISEIHNNPTQMIEVVQFGYNVFFFKTPCKKSAHSIIDKGFIDSCTLIRRTKIE